MKKLKLLLAGIGFSITLALPGLASADVNDFIINSFTADETLSRNDQQGTLHVVENIHLTYRDYNHGILRAIPKTYKGHSLQLKVNRITSDSGAPTQFSTYTSNGNTVLKIGDASKTITGNQQYTIDYTLHNVISFYPDHDELYWDVNGDQWGQEFTQVAVNLHLPSDLKTDRTPVCYTGSYGQTSQNCIVQNPQSQDISVLTTRALNPYETLTYVVGFDKGYFKPSTFIERVGEYSKEILAVGLPVIAIAGSAATGWYRKGRDPKGRRVIVPQYDAPPGLSPLQAGTIMDFKADNRDITATIVDLAVRKYIRIIEEKKDRLLGKDKLEYSLMLLKADVSQLNSQEVLLLTSLFPKLEVNELVSLAVKKGELFSLATTLRKSVKDQLGEQGYFRQDRLSALKTLMGLLKALAAIALLFIAFVVFSPLVVLGVLIGVVVALPFWNALDARTAKGVEAKEYMEGLKMYLDVAEKQRIEKLQAPNAAYAANAGEPVKTVELFEKLLPYAIILGVEQQWAEQFKDLYNQPPDWYSGNWSSFNTGYLASILISGIGSAVNTAFAAPASSGSSGFGGGGGSGGGGGGGGGGGW